ncbi:hypothetical protein N665_1095s0007 [Sinapis alba]|nr:hypothetical protein N665_1095s0007 [Sinapis alba]
MASKISASLIIFLTFNILFFTLTTACGGGCSSIPKPKPKPTPTPSSSVKPCCSLLKGLVDLEAAACLCTALKANVLGIKLNVPVSLSLLLNACGRKTPRGFICA